MNKYFVQELEKISVDLNQVRTAWNKTVRPLYTRRKRMREPHAIAGEDMVRKELRKVLQKRGLKGRVLEWNINLEVAKFKGNPRQGYLSMPKKTTIVGGGKRGGLLPIFHSNKGRQIFGKEKHMQGASPEGYEGLNRIVGLHEGAEARTIREISSGKRREANFGHLGRRPPMQDLIIAATYTGPDADKIRKTITRMRQKETFASIKELRHAGRPDLAKKVGQMFEQAGRGLQAGEARALNRHTINDLDNTMVKYMEGIRSGKIKPLQPWFPKKRIRKPLVSNTTKKTMPSLGSRRLPARPNVSPLRNSTAPSVRVTSPTPIPPTTVPLPANVMRPAASTTMMGTIGKHMSSLKNRMFGGKAVRYASPMHRRNLQ